MRLGLADEKVIVPEKRRFSNELLYVSPRNECHRRGAERISIYFEPSLTQRHFPKLQTQNSIVLPVRIRVIMFPADNSAPSKCMHAWTSPVFYTRLILPHLTHSGTMSKQSLQSHGFVVKASVNHRIAHAHHNV